MEIPLYTQAEVQIAIRTLARARNQAPPYSHSVAESMRVAYGVYEFFERLGKEKLGTMARVLNLTDTGVDVLGRLNVGRVESSLLGGEEIHSEDISSGVQTLNVYSAMVDQLIEVKRARHFGLPLDERLSEISALLKKEKNREK